nr:DNA-processing protein DprA [Candidatus Freyarchaeota archaeon]
MEGKNLSNSQSVTENIYWLALQDKLDLISTRKVANAVQELGSMKLFWNASDSYFYKLGLDDKTIRKFNEHKNKIRLENYWKMLESLDQMSVKIIRYIDDDYPEMLRELDDSPLLILHKGSVKDFHNCVAVVGTRNASLYGHTMARKLSRSIASKGYTIVSGLARGIDIWAHYGALEASGGRTIAVLPWMVPVYPPEHAEFLKDIEKRGAVLSERFEKPSDKSAPSKFVQRNRITSGISRCVVVIESDAEGGTVHQVRIALSQGRKVFALKPKDNERAERGFKAFLEMGVTPIESDKEVLKFLDETPLKAEERKLDSYYQHSLD